MNRLLHLGFFIVFSVKALAEHSPETFTAEIEHILLNSGVDKSAELAFHTPPVLTEARKETLDTYLKQQIYSSFGQVLRNPSAQDFMTEEEQILFSTFSPNNEIPPYLHFINQVSRDTSFYKAALDGYQVQCASVKTAEAGALGMGILYHQGWGVAKSLPKSFEYLTKAAYGKNPVALTVLGYGYHSGENDQSNRDQAVEYYKNALTHHLKNTTTKAFLAEILLLSPKTPHDKIEGEMYLQQALDAKEPYAFLIKAYDLYQQTLQSSLGLSAEEQKQRVEEALKCIEKANAKGLKNTTLFKDILKQKLESFSAPQAYWIID